MNNMKKFLSAFVAMGMLLTMAGCGADETADSRVSTSKSESVADNEAAEQTELVAEETKASAGKLEDSPELTIELKDGKIFTYNGENFSDVYQQLTDLSLVTDDAKTKYETEGIFNSGRLEASNGTLFFIDYLSNKKEFIVRTGSGVKNKVAWNITIGGIDNTMTISDLVNMGAEAIREESSAHGDRTTDYLLTSENFETKGVSIKASGDGSPKPEDLIAEGIYITYSGVEK